MEGNEAFTLARLTPFLLGRRSRVRFVSVSAHRADTTAVQGGSEWVKDFRQMLLGSANRHE